MSSPSDTDVSATLATRSELGHANAPLRASGSDRAVKSTQNAAMPLLPEKPFTYDFKYLEGEHPFLVPMGHDGIIEAIKRLDHKLLQAGRPSIICNKRSSSWTGRPVNPGNIGLVDSAGLPELLIKPGLYPGFPWRLWWTRTRRGIVPTNTTHIEWLGLCCVQVTQTQAAVVMDPQAKIFVVKDGGFAALAGNGSYKVLAIVDQTHLNDAIFDRHTTALLGHKQEVTTQDSRSGLPYVVATFLSIPANNVAVLQRDNKLFQLGAGQHVITDSTVTFRNMFTTGDTQIEMKCKEIYTKDSVPLSMTIFLRWQLVHPLKLSAHGYESPFDALQDKTHSILTQIVSHLEYASLIRQRSLNTGLEDDPEADAATFLDALRTRAIDDLDLAAEEYGIKIKDLAVFDRQFKGQIAQTMDDLTRRSLQAQVEAANVDRENSNMVKKEEGHLRVAEIAARTKKAEADGDAYAVVAKAKADGEALLIKAKAEAEALKFNAAAEAESIQLHSHANEQVKDQFAREIAHRRVEVERVRAFGNRTVFAPAEVTGSMSTALAVGISAGAGHRSHV